MKRSPMPRRKKPMKRSEIKRTPFARSGGGEGHRAPTQKAPLRKTPLRPVSAKKSKAQRDRVAVLREATGGAPVACGRCDRAEANDAHEVLPRSQGGSATDLDNIRFLCRSCHDWIGSNPVEARATGWLLRSTDSTR